MLLKKKSAEWQAAEILFQVSQEENPHCSFNELSVKGLVQKTREDEKEGDDHVPDSVPAGYLPQATEPPP